MLQCRSVRYEDEVERVGTMQTCCPSSLRAEIFFSFFIFFTILFGNSIIIVLLVVRIVFAIVLFFARRIVFIIVCIFTASRMQTNAMHTYVC